MSILPWLLDLADDLSEFNSPHGLDGDFGLSLHPREFRRNNKFQPRMYLAYPRHKQCPYALSRGACKVQGGEVCKKGDRNESVVGKDGFQVCMDVQQFKPNELTVKTVDNAVVVEGKHEEREDDHGFISRHFVRKYTLPKGYDAKEVVSTLSSDGILTVKAPPPPKQSAEINERVVQIQQTGPAHLTVKENPKEVENGAAGGDKNDKMED